MDAWKIGNVRLIPYEDGDTPNEEGIRVVPAIESPKGVPYQYFLSGGNADTYANILRVREDDDGKSLYDVEAEVSYGWDGPDSVPNGCSGYYNSYQNNYEKNFVTSKEEPYPGFSIAEHYVLVNNRNEAFVVQILSRNEKTNWVQIKFLNNGLISQFHLDKEPLWWRRIHWARLDDKHQYPAGY